MAEMTGREFQRRLDSLGREGDEIGEIAGEWTADLTGYVDDFPCPVWQVRGRLQVMGIRLSEAGDEIEIVERADDLRPLMAGGEMVTRWIPTPIRVPERVRSVVDGSVGG